MKLNGLYDKCKLQLSIDKLKYSTYLFNEYLSKILKYQHNYFLYFDKNNSFDWNLECCSRGV